MLKFISSELHHSFILTKWTSGTWMFLYFMVSGAQSLVTVHQPPVVTAALGSDVVMPCQLMVSPDERVQSVPVLYWEPVLQDSEKSKLWDPSGKYKGRVDILDQDKQSSNKSILLKKVQWADHGKYLCKLSITTDKSFRRKGNETLLMVYDTITFNLTQHNDSLLRCEVKVTRGPGFFLSVFHNECKPDTIDRARRDVATLPYVTLSETVSLRGDGKYECQLQLNGDLITKRAFNYTAVVAEEDQENVSEPVEGVFPEPWLLYVALLLVPITILLGLLTAMLMWKP